MRLIRVPLDIPDLNLKPPIQEMLQLSDDVQQTLAMAVGFSINKRVPLVASPSGVLRITSPRMIDVVHITGSGANDHPTLPDQPCTECMIMAHPDNGDKIWIRNSTAATTSNAWPMNHDDVINVSVDNVNQLSILIVADGEKAIILVGK